MTVRGKPSRKEPAHDQRRGERAPDSDAARDFALARSARDQPLDDREADQGGSEELCVEGRLRHRQAEEFEEGVPGRGEQKDRERSVADRVKTQDASRGGSRRSTRRGYDSTEQPGGDLVSTWSVLRESCKPRSPVGLVNPPGNKQVRRTTNSHSPPNFG